MRCAVVAVVVACSGPSPVRMPPRPPSQAWQVAPDRWTTTLPIIDAVALDVSRAVAIVGDRTWDDHGIERLESFGNGLASIDLVSGAVTERDDVVPEPGRIYGLVRVPTGTLLAFGLADGHTAAWRVDPQTLALSPLPMPAPAAANQLRVGASFDNTRIASCSGGVTVVRDTATLAIVDTLTSEQCSWGFPGETALDRPGPNGQRLRRPGSFWRLYTADNREIGELRSESIRWRGDGNGAIAVDRGNLVWMPTSGPLRQLPLPTQRAAARPIPGRKEILVLLGDHQVGFADPETLTLRTLEGHPLGAVRGLAFRGDLVLTGADTLRAWHAGALVEAGPPTKAWDVKLFAAGPREPVLVSIDGGSLASWLPGSNTPPVPREDGATRIDRAGEAWMATGFDDFSVRAGTRDHLVPIFTPVYRRKPAWTWVIDLDAARGQLLMIREDTYYVITPATKRATPIAAPCDRSHFEVSLAHVGPGVVGVDAKGLVRFDQSTGLAIDSLGEPSPNKRHVWISADEIAFTEERRRGGRIILWSPGKAIAAAPKRRAPVTSLAVDREHGLLAIGHGDGSFEVEPLAELRARAVALEAHPRASSESCLKSQPFEELVDDGKQPD